MLLIFHKFKMILASDGTNGGHILPSPVRDRPRFSGIEGILAYQIPTCTHKLYPGLEIIRQGLTRVTPPVGISGICGT
jgi:hypothetical protein